MKITLSKRQWEFVGEQAGWIKQEAGIQDVKNKILGYLQKLPVYNQAMEWVNKLKGGQITIEQLIQQVGISPEHIDAANNFMQRFGVSASGNQNAEMKKEAAGLDFRVVLVILFSILFIIGLRALKNAVDDINADREKQIEQYMNPYNSK
jgi:hypothetical protein